MIVHLVAFKVMGGNALHEMNITFLSGVTAKGNPLNNGLPSRVTLGGYRHLSL